MGNPGFVRRQTPVDKSMFITLKPTSWRSEVGGSIALNTPADSSLKSWASPCVVSLAASAVVVSTELKVMVESIGGRISKGQTNGNDSGYGGGADRRFRCGLPRIAG